MQASLIIAVYNQARNLELILETVKLQTCQEIEIIIADDGSGDRTPDVVESFRTAQPGLPLSFVTQEDMGFRKTVILNKAIKLANTDYLIFIDGDMLLEKHFVQLHLHYRRQNHVLCGHRGVKLTESYTGKLLEGKKMFSTEPLNLIVQKFKGNLSHPLRGLIIKNPLLRRFAVHNRKNLSGCNFSLYRQAIEKVNGFNEDILEHGYNDYELGCRLVMAGYKIIDVSKLCNTYHLYHPTRKTGSEEIREKIKKSSESNDAYCINGLKKPDEETRL